ncbi:transcriptional regulator [Thalassobaculum fulvum]|uniref:Transcriptional regulator n=1 Tax=Thalassobaculum fulvum TaxID=1633335 RepID=A0A918XSQ4_9PROT|nr:MarR family winged helix-turn-helix transcriptional regulator [Thalassobaculum fulvum]GHD49040.1 transcriptional regulator [Thalassobaculum fulvum]
MNEQDPARRPTARRAVCPEGRLSNPTRDKDGRPVIDVTAYIPYFLTSVTNALSRGASQLYLETFGVGIVEWRAMATLASEPRIPAARICELVALDKAATSRALARLHELGYLGFEAPEPDPRKKVWWLNDEGYRLHDRILAVALERERRLIDGVDPEDLETFLRVMRIMRRNVDGIASDRGK